MEHRPTEHELHEARLTAYALGELNGTGTSEFDDRLKSDAAFRAEVEAIRASAKSLEKALQHGAASSLTAAQREKIESALRVDHPPAPLIFTKRSFWIGAAGTALAASLAAAFILPTLFPNGTSEDGAFVLGDGTADSSLNVPSQESLSPNDASGNLSGGMRSRLDEAKENTIRPEGGSAAGSRARQSEPEGRASGGERGMSETERLRDRLTSPSGRPQSENAAASSGPSPQAPSRPPAQTATVPGAGGGAPREAGEGAPANREASDEFRRNLDDGLMRMADEAGQLVENPFVSPTGDQDSTFSIDVDTATYSLMRRSLNEGVLPRPDSVRIEEMLNYFHYHYDSPSAGDAHPFKESVEVATAPWSPGHRLIRIGLKARDIDMANRVGTNLVFLLDISGSMNGTDRLPLLKKSMKMFVDQLTADDRVAIVTYAGAAGLALPSTYCNNKVAILDAIENLRAGGSTNGAEGIQLAYELASTNFIDGGANRVIWATDGDLNVGVTGDEALVSLIEEKRASGVYLTTLGFGTGNFKDSKLEKVTDAGNGNYAYIDSIDEAKRVLVEQIGGTLFTVAKDVKIQVDFNPDLVREFRLIGYENRVLAREDFLNDAKDAGEIGAGHTVTALYEIVPVGLIELAEAPQPPTPAGGGGGGNAGGRDHDRADPGGWLMRLKLRYKLPDDHESSGFEAYISDSEQHWSDASDDFRFAAGVSSFGLMLRHSQYAGESNVELVRQLITPRNTANDDSYREEFRRLVGIASSLLDPR